MHFFYKYTPRRDAFSYEPEPHWNKHRVWRLVYGAAPEEIFAYLPASCGWGREDCFTSLRAAVDGNANPQLHTLLWQNDINPSKARPAFLYAKHQGDEAEEFPALPVGK